MWKQSYLCYCRYIRYTFLYLLENGELFTWGFGSDGQLGLGSTQNHHSPQLVTFTKGSKNTQPLIIDVDAGAQHTVALTGILIRAISFL